MSTLVDNASQVSRIHDSFVQAKARSIMGKNFLGFEEVHQGYGIALDPEQFVEIPFSEETLLACKDTHVLVAGVPLSLNDVRKLAIRDFYGTDWYNHDLFANENKVSARWYLLRKEPVPKTHDKTYEQQTALLKGEKVSYACEMTYMVILYWLTHRERLLQRVYVRCQDKISGGDHVGVGLFTSDGFFVANCWDEFRDDDLGLASSVPPRKY